MFLEHIVITLGIALWCSFFLYRRIDLFTGLIVMGACLPDIDGIIDVIRYPLDFSNALLPSLTAHNRYFHSVVGLLLFALLMGIALTRFGVSFSISALATGIGFSSHLLEDALVYNPAATFFWPLSSERIGIGIVDQYYRDFLGVANTMVLTLGLLFVLIAILPWVISYKFRWAERSDRKEFDRIGRGEL